MSVLIVGAGIIGLSAAFYLRRKNIDVSIVDPDPAGDKASFGNAAGIGVSECLPAGGPGIWKKVPAWLLDPLGPLFVKPSHAPRLLPWIIAFLKASSPERVAEISAALAALNNRVYNDYAPVWAALDYDRHVHRVGCLAAYSTRAAYVAEAADWERRRELGVRFEEIGKEKLREMEPALAAGKSFAIYLKDWSHIDDPKDLMDRLRQHLAVQGVEFLRARARAFSADADGARVHLENGDTLFAAYAVNAAGAWSGELARTIGDRPLLESERGYNKTITNPGCQINHEIVFAEEKFVATPLSVGLRIGGAAEFAGLTSPANYKRSDVLHDRAREFLPELSQDPGVAWMGHRPTTPDSLPIIGASPRTSRIVHAFGHGHLGLTQGPTTGCLVAELISGEKSGLDLNPYRIERFDQARS